MRKLNLLALAVYLISSGSALADYDQCQDILRDGIRDKINSSDTLDYRLARKHEFCRLSNKYKLDSTDYDNFARDYAKATHAHKYVTSNGTKVGYGPFSLGNDFATNSTEDDLSEGDKFRWLKTNETAVRDYRKSNCGKEDLTESLQTEAVLYSEIANKDVVEAWRTCMIEKLRNGMFVDIIKDDAHEDDECESVTYTVNAYFKSDQGVSVSSMVLSHTGNILTNYQISKSVNGFYQTVNILGQGGWIWRTSLSSGGNKNINVNHLDRKTSGKLTVLAKLSTGSNIEQSVSFPKRVMPVIELEKPHTADAAVQVDPPVVIQPDPQTLKSVKLTFETTNQELDHDSLLDVVLRRKSDGRVVGTWYLHQDHKKLWTDNTTNVVDLVIDDVVAAKIESKNDCELYLKMTPNGHNKWRYVLTGVFNFSANDGSHSETFTTGNAELNSNNGKIREATYSL